MAEPFAFARIIHEDFYCNRRYAAATNLTAGGLAAPSVNILFQVCLPPSRLRTPVSPGISAVSSRTLVNNAGYASRNGPFGLWSDLITPLARATRGLRKPSLDARS